MKASLQGIHPVLATNDMAASLEFYRRLGFVPSFQDRATEPNYVVLGRDAVELHIQWAGLDQWAHPVDRPTYRFIVSDVDGIYAEFIGSGAVAAAAPSSTVSPWAAPQDTPWGTREFHIRDPGHNSLQFYRPL